MDLPPGARRGRLTRRRRALVAAVAAATALAGAGCGGGLGTEAQVFVVGAEDGKVRQLTDDALSYAGPSWSPDGLRLAAGASTPNRAA